jgi:hypothetical protein
MSPPTKLPPIHVDILRIWRDRGLELAQEPAIAEEVEAVLEIWEEIAEFKRGEMEERQPTIAQMEYELDLHTGQVKVYDPHWLANTFEADQFVELQRAVCEFLYPEHAWETVGVDDGHWVATNESRSLVCDMKLMRHLSAAASLALAGDEVLRPTPDARAEVERYHGDRRNLELNRLTRLQEVIESFSQEGTLIPFPVH